MLSDEAKKYLQERADKFIEPLKNSHCFMGLVGPAYLKDVQCMLQLGAAICMDKPIFLIVIRGTKIPENLKNVTKAIIYADENSESMEKAAKELTALIKEIE